MAAEAAASSTTSGSRPAAGGCEVEALGKCRRLAASCHHGWRPTGSPLMLALLVLLLGGQQQSVSAIVCEIDARDGLEAATASVAAAATDRQQLLHLVPLCRVPYLVNSQLPPKDVPHVGMEKGATVTIDLQLLPSDYKNNMPARKPRVSKVRRPAAREKETEGASEYDEYKRQQQRQQQPYFRQAEERHTNTNGSASGNRGRDSTESEGERADMLPTSMLLHTDVSEGPLAALSATFPLLAHAGRRLSEIFSFQQPPRQDQRHVQQQQHQQQEQQQQRQQREPQEGEQQQSWSGHTLATLTRAAGGGFEFLVNNFLGLDRRSPRLLLSSLPPPAAAPPAGDTSFSASASAIAHQATSLNAEEPAAAAAAAPDSVEEVLVPPLARIARRRDCGRQLHRRTIGCPEWEADPSPHSRVRGVLHAAVRQLAKAEEDDRPADGLVHSVNNTALLLLDHAQLVRRIADDWGLCFEQGARVGELCAQYFMETHEAWLPSFTAEDGLVLNSYMPSMLRLPFTGPRLQTTISLPYRDRYALILLNADGLNLKLQGSVSFWGPTQQHLSLEQRYLPETVAFLMLLNLLAACILGVLQLTRWKGHNLFLSVLFMINFNLAGLAFGLDWRQAKIVEATGRRPAGLWVASRLLRKLQDVSQLLVFIFVSLGFDVVRTRLSRLEVQFIAGLAVISLYLGVFEVLLGGFQETRYIFHAAGYVRVLIAIHSNIVLLHNRIADSSLTPAVGELYSKLAAYQRYRWIFFAFLLKPVFSVFFKVTFLGPIYEQLLSWDEWIYVIFENGTDFAVVAALCWDFCPPRSLKVLRLVTTESTNSSPEQQQRELVWGD